MPVDDPGNATVNRALRIGHTMCYPVLDRVRLAILVLSHRDFLCAELIHAHDQNAV